MSQELPFESLTAVGSNALRWFHRLERLGPEQVQARRSGPSGLNVPPDFVDEWMEYRRTRDARDRRNRAALVSGIAGAAILGALVLYRFALATLSL
jgi:hypothetical protein